MALTPEEIAATQYFDETEYVNAKARIMVLNGKSNSLEDAKAQFLSKWTGDLIDHYLQYGAAENVNPSNSFDNSNYIQQVADAEGVTYQEVKAEWESQGITPLQHFLDEGQALGYTAPPVPEGEQVPGYVEPEPTDLRFMLTANQDLLTDEFDGGGGDGDDLFRAPVVQEGGLQVNSLGTGDWLDGGAGDDTLDAGVTRGATFGLSNMPIGPITENIENIQIKAINADIGVNDYQLVMSNLGIGGINEIIEQLRDPHEDEGQNGPGREPDFEDIVDYALDLVGELSLSFDVSTKKANTDVFVDAADMTGVDVIGSNYSGADLTIMNLTTKATQDYDSARNLDEMTVRMAYTSSSDTHWDASDLNVYFDPDFLKPVTKYSDPTIDILVMNEDAYDETDAELPLAGVFLRELTITVNGERFDLTQYIGEDPDGAGEEIETYPELLAAIQDAIVELKADNLDNAALQTLEAELGIPFLTDVDPDTLIRREGTTIRLTIDGATDGEENTLLVESTDLEVARAADANYENNNRYERADNDPAVPEDVLAINVDLEKVGLAGDGGDLVIGSMFKDGQNVWSDKYAGQGIDQFNVTVYGDEDKPSSLASLSSTGNNLRVVNVVSDPDQTDSFAGLTIGNSNTQGIAGLKDVQTFDASLFKGDLTLHAALTDEVTAKYLDLQDQAPAAPAADNVPFDYTGGIGDDFFNITLAAANMAAAGTVTREDFEMTVDGGNGNDIINLAIVDNSGLATDFAMLGSWGYWTGEEFGLANWYDNQKLNANLTVKGGAGNDIIMTPGTGDVVIDAGSGNDAVYADNAGDKATWVFNTLSDAPIHTHLASTDQGILGLQSDVNNSYTLYKSDLVVDYKGFEVAVELAHTNGKVTDLQINQAIKAAINGDETMNKMLVAYDGPGNTLVIESKIDGIEWSWNSDLDIRIEAPDALTAGEVQQLSNWLGLAGQSEATLLALIENQIDDFEDKDDYGSTLAYSRMFDGMFSIHTSDNIITPGLGDDVVVLGTGVMSNDTVVYEGFGNGVDTIVNFDTNIVDWEIPVPSQNVTEQVTITFSDFVGDEPSSIAFDGSTINLDFNANTQGLIPAADVAYQFVDGYTTAGWTATWIPGTGTVTLTSTTPNADQTDLTETDFTLVGGGTVTIDQIVDGSVAYSQGTFAVLGLDLTGTIISADGTFVFDGAEVDYEIGDGAITLAAKLADASFDSWNVVDNLDGTITLTAKETGTVVPADIINQINIDNPTLAADGVVESTSVTQLGTPDTGEITYIPVEAMAGLDYLDFSDYDAEAVYVDGVLVAGTAPADEDDLFITMTQDVDNAGEYTVELINAGEDGLVGGGDDTVVGLIGVADFGQNMDFVEDNFIL